MDQAGIEDTFTYKNDKIANTLDPQQMNPNSPHTYIYRKRRVYVGFMDLEKAYDRANKEALC